MATRCRGIDWSATSLGPVEQWDPALRTMVRSAMECPFAINLWCGPDKILIYNDAYRPCSAQSIRARSAGPAPRYGPRSGPTSGRCSIRSREGKAVLCGGRPFVMERSGGRGLRSMVYVFAQSRSLGNGGNRRLSQRRVGDHGAGAGRTRSSRGACGRRTCGESVARSVHAGAGISRRAARSRSRVRVRELGLPAARRPAQSGGYAVAEALPEVRAGVHRVARQGLWHGRSRSSAGRCRSCCSAPGSGRKSVASISSISRSPMRRRDHRHRGAWIGRDGGGGGAARDRAASRESEETRAAVVESEARYRFLANAIPVQVWTATPEGALDYVSERAAFYFGVRKSRSSASMAEGAASG